ncbi:MAG: thioredoxin domain-containing protein [Deltaproteobacteria bacterium]|nr:thioredoxin domain-containing protein [Deltaproteobacteria bacterium]
MSKSKTKQAQRSKPFLLAIVLVCIIGVGIAVDLTRVYLLSNKDPSFESFCAVSEGVNCQTVALSDYAATFGVANSVWAIFAYVWLAVVAVWGMVRRSADGWPTGLVLAVSSALLVVAVLLLGIMKFAIGSLCILCMGLDAVNVALFVLALARWRNTAPRSKPWLLLWDDLRWVLAKPKALVGMTGLTIGLLVATVAYSNYLEQLIVAARPPLGAEEQDGQLQIGPDQFVPRPGPAAHACKGADCECGHGHEATAQGTIQMGRDEHGHQWVGAAEPKKVVHEFTDYECPFCRKAHMRVRALMGRNPSYLRVVHRNYPLDQACNPAITKPFHKRACLLAKVAYCAGQQGRFWEMNDYLFQQASQIRKGDSTGRQLAEQLELDLDKFDCCLTSKEAEAHIRKDIEEGMKHQIRGTPSFVVDGQVSAGSLPKELIAEILGE